MADDNMNIPDLIIKKRNGGELEKKEIESFVTGVVSEAVQPSQTGAMLMAMYLKGLTIQETTCLTRAMVNSGETLKWPEKWDGFLVDKHSTGGVGDKVSLILAPALAACEMKVPMISGRGLAHTAGTLDKLEAIPGFQVSMTSEEMLDILENVGCCIVGQTGRLCPADGKMYAIRDITGTVDHTGLISASIVSKKAAENVNALVLDVKFGKGAFLQDKSKAKRLAEIMVNSGKELGIKTVALLTDMNSPLGKMVGHSLEVVEVITCLHGSGPRDLTDLVAHLGGHLLASVGKANHPKEGCRMILDKIQDGSALARFCAMLKGQGVDHGVADNLCSRGFDVFSVLPAAETKTDLMSPVSGYVHEVDAMACAVVVQKLGAGRSKAGEMINHSVGLELMVSVGDEIFEGSPWVRVHHSGADLAPNLRDQLEKAIVVQSKSPGTNSNRVADVIV